MSGRYHTKERSQKDENEIKINKGTHAMDSLKIAADKVKRSPKLVRKKIDKAIHKDKDEGKETPFHWSPRFNIEMGMTFNVKFIGRKETIIPNGTGCTSKIVDELVANTKQNKTKTGEKLKKLSFTISAKTISLKDLESEEIFVEFPIEKVSYCSSHTTTDHPKVFSFIAKHDDSKLFAYVILLNKPKMAEAMSLTVAQAFTMAYEDLQEQRKDQINKIDADQEIEQKQLYKHMTVKPLRPPPPSPKMERKSNPEEGSVDVNGVKPTPTFSESLIADPYDVGDDDGGKSVFDDDDFFKGIASNGNNGNTAPAVMLNDQPSNGNATIEMPWFQSPPMDAFKSSEMDDAFAGFLSTNNTASDLQRSCSTMDLSGGVDTPPRVGSPSNSNASDFNLMPESIERVSSFSFPTLLSPSPAASPTNPRKMVQQFDQFSPFNSEHPSAPIPQISLNNPFQQSVDPYQGSTDPFAQTSASFQQSADPFQQSTDPFQKSQFDQFDEFQPQPQTQQTIAVATTPQSDLLIDWS